MSFISDKKIEPSDIKVKPSSVISPRMSAMPDRRAGLTPEERRFGEAIARHLPDVKGPKGDLAKRAGLGRQTIYALKDAPSSVAMRNVISVSRELGIDVATEVLGLPSQSQPRGTDNGETVAFPLVAEGVAAGFGAIPEEPDERTDYHFRKGWKGIRGWDADPSRYVLFRLKRDADSMVPEIQPNSLILADRSEGGRLDPKPNGYYLVLVNPPDHVAVKRVMPVRNGEKIARLVFLSANPAYPPKEVAVKRIQDVIRAKVVWWGTEAT